MISSKKTTELLLEVNYNYIYIGKQHLKNIQYMYKVEHLPSIMNP